MTEYKEYVGQFEDEKMGEIEREEMMWCNAIDEKLEKLDRWHRGKAKCNNGYKNRKR